MRTGLAIDAGEEGLKLRGLKDCASKIEVFYSETTLTVLET
jgi:hypothetical protein